MATLKYRDPVSGQWVPLTASAGGGGGSDEVTIAHAPEPATSGLELWVDLDSSPAAAGGLPTGGTPGQVLTKNSTADYGATWADSPKGLLALAERTTDFIGIQSALTDIPGLSISFTVPAGRRIRVTGAANFYKNAGDVSTWAVLQVIGGSVSNDAVAWVLASGFGWVSPSCFFTSTAMTYTFKAQAQTGGGYVNISGSSTRRAQIWAEDVGAA